METETLVKQSLGARLMEARTNDGLEERETADKLKITPTYLRAIENDNYDALPDIPFVAGYLKAYARLLDLDVDSILAEFYSQVRPVAGDQEKASNNSSGAVSKLSGKNWILIVIISLIVWVIAVSLYDQNKQPVAGGQISSQATIEESQVDEKVSELESFSQIVEGATAVLEPSAVVIDAKENLELSVVTITDIAPANTPVPINTAVSSDELQIIFNDECWLEVTDSDGDVLAADIYQAGDEFKTQGNAPFTVMLGNVRYAEVFLNGKAFTLVPDGFRKTLRTTVGE
jgi:cytoskeleton protein RodZ